MTARIVTWTHDMPTLGAATVAIGVFDGVHIGHQSLLREAVADAKTRGVSAVAVTFDRDPDQVVSPETAAPQLLSLADKLDCIAQTGIDVILLVPFTSELAEMAPESFVDRVLLSAMRPVTVHVGRDFRFGVRATGDVNSLQRLGLTHDFEVWPHELVTAEGAPVTSTRIRALVANGDVAAAGQLLCRKTRVTGSVVSGRGEGRKLGFPTANVEPIPYAALPADGVYAGRAILQDGAQWAAAISVGTPPTFPEARDYLEAHLIEFEGDLYQQILTLEFWAKLREQQAYASLSDLTEAIGADVTAALDIAGFEDDEDDGKPRDDDRASQADEDHDAVSSSDSDLIDDPEALAAAEAAVAAIDEGDSPFDQIAGDWAALLTDIYVAEGPDAAASAFAITSPLKAAGIPVAWEPTPPGESPSGTRGRYPSVFTLWVPHEQLNEACQALVDTESPYVSELPEFTPPPAEDVEDGSYDSAAGIDDPAALEAAENAVRTIQAEPRRAETPAPEGWVTIDRDMAYDKPKLGEISYALAAAGIPADWAPFEPEEAPLLKLFGLHETRFSVRVPREDADAALQILGEVEQRHPAR